MSGFGLPELIVLLVIVAIPVGIVVLVLVIKGVAGGKTVPCPRCAEKIQPQARMCRFCGLDLTPR